MYNLEQKQFKISVTLCSILFLPNMIVMVIANCLFFRMELLIILLVIMFMYLTCIVVLEEIEKKKKLEMLYPNSNGIEKEWQLACEQIIKNRLV